MACDSSSIWQRAERAFEAWSKQDVEFCCYYCQVNFSVEDSLFRHVRIVHRVEEKKYINDNPGFMVKRPKIKCQICGKDIESIDRHLVDKHHGTSAEFYFLKHIYFDEASLPREAQGVYRYMDTSCLISLI